MSISATSLAKLFTLTDTDESNSLSASELADIEDSLPNPTGASAEQMVKNMDTNGDGSLSETEFTQGVQLNENVNNALLSAQEMMSGNTLLELLSGDSNSSDSSLASLYGSTDTDVSSLLSSSEDSTSTDYYTSLLQQYIDKYGSLDSETSDTATATTTTTTTTTEA